MDSNFGKSRFLRSRWCLAIVMGWIVLVTPVYEATAQPPGVKSQTAAGVDPDIWNIARGGQLYDDWMAVLDAEPPSVTHPAYPTIGKKKGKATWRCKECHGWDYMGEDGAYGKGAHFTGIKGMRNVVNMDVQKIQSIIMNDTHAYTPKMIPERALKKLALFLSLGQVGMDQYIDRSTREARGDPRRGALFFQTVCAICHGFDGSRMAAQGETSLAAFGDLGSLGAIANRNPWESLHKIRNGQPGVGMVALRILKTQDQVDVLAYMQTLGRGQ